MKISPNGLTKLGAAPHPVPVRPQYEEYPFPTINQKFSDVCVVQSELEAMMYKGCEVRYFARHFVPLANARSAFIGNEDWVPHPWHPFTTPGTTDWRSAQPSLLCADPDHETEQAHRIWRCRAHQTFLAPHRHHLVLRFLPFNNPNPAPLWTSRPTRPHK